MERWRAEGDPSDAAILAQARAFFALNMLDRTAARLAELTEDGRGTGAAWALRARLYHRQGLLDEAHAALERAAANAPGDPTLVGLEEEIAGTPTEIDGELEADADTAPEVLLGLAERHLQAGSFHRARRILERLKRATPSNDRVDDLLWVLDGDFTLEESLAQLAAKNLGIADLPDLPDEVEHTESVARADVVLPEEPEGHAFPSLFRHIEPATDPYADGPEVTATHTVANLAALSIDPAETTSPGDDTQIQRVVSTHALEPSDRIHEAVPKVAPDFDLGTFRREMGMEHPGFGAVESEDDARIVFRPREESGLATNVEIEPLELELDPPTESRHAEDEPAPEPPRDRGLRDAGEPPRRPAVGPPDNRSEEPARRKRTPPGTAIGHGWAYWIAALAALMGLGLLLLVGIAAIALLT